MSSPRAPLWMYLAAVSFVGALSLIIYAAVWGPGPVGIETDYGGGSMIVQQVHANGAGAHAGMLAGDRIVAVNGITIHGQRDWEVASANFEIARPIRMEIERDGRRIQLFVTLGRGPWAILSTPEGLFYGADVVTLVLALVLAFWRPYDLVARLGAWFLATIAITMIPIPYGWAALWRHLPAPLGVLLWVASVSRTLFPGIFFSFFAMFPRRLFRKGWVWLLVWAPALVEAGRRLRVVFLLFYEPERAPGGSFVFDERVLMLYVLGGLAALLVNYRRSVDVNERRRVRVMVAGSVVGWLGLLTLLELFFYRGVGFRLPSIIPFMLTSVYMVFPLSFAYAILRHRMFDLGVILRRGLQYALARRLLLSVPPALAATLLLDVLLHGNQPVFVVLRARIWAYGALAALVAIAYTQRGQWLEALDRHFFREHYNANRLLRKVAEEIGEARSFGQVAPRVVTYIETALHPEFVDLLCREPHEPCFQSLAAAPPGHVLPTFPAENKLVALIRLLRKPIEVPQSSAGWLKEQLPQAETAFLQQSRIELLVPIATSMDCPEALLVLGSKRSEEPYLNEDLDLLVAIATSLAMLLGKPHEADSTRTDVFDECPQCGACYDHGAVQCSRDKARLVPMILPRLLVGRYHLERRLGRGGMGIVYAASDSTLERRVAVKVIREDLVGSAEAAERFRREARVAANFTHPNVVTIYDFGVAGARAFLVMELLEGRSLREALLGGKRFLPAHALPLLQDVCTALEAAHLRRLVHRDLKPENIFLVARESSETAKLLDFGLAKFLRVATDQLTTDTAPGVVLGTPRYMSPEQCHGGEAHPTWDLWALAIVTYEMLVGTYPFDVRSPADWLWAGPVARFAPVAAHLPEAPRRWQEFFEHSFTFDPAKRPQSVPIFLSELRGALS